MDQTLSSVAQGKIVDEVEMMLSALANWCGKQISSLGYLYLLDRPSVLGPNSALRSMLTPLPSILLAR